MPYLASMIWGALAMILQSLVGRILLYIGISYVTYQGVDTLFSSMLSQANTFLGSAGVLTGIIGIAKIDASLNVVVSALVAKYTMSGLQNGSLTKTLFK